MSTAEHLGNERAAQDLAADAVLDSTPRARDARLRRLVDDNYELVWRWMRGLGVSTSGVDDAVQQVFWIAAQKIETITPGSERAFLLSTGRGVAANARRSQTRKEQPDEDALSAQLDPAPDPEQSAASNQGKRLLEEVLQSMPERLRAVFVLFELESLTTAAIAELLAIPPGTAASRLRRAREAFHSATKRLQSRGGGHS